MSNRGAALFLALPCFLIFMSIGPGCPRAFPAEALATGSTAMHALPTPGAGTHSRLPASAMHPLNAPVPAGSSSASGRIIQGEKQVLIHGASLPGVNSLAR